VKSFRKKTRSEWQKIIFAWRESGMTVGRFCKEQGITEGRFYSWRKHFGFGTGPGGEGVTVQAKKHQPAVKFLPMQVKELPAVEIKKKTAHQQRIEIFLDNGALIRIFGELSDNDVSKLVKLATATSC